jgi:hypothetical protein
MGKKTASPMIHHVAIAAIHGVQPLTIRRWIALGKFPKPRYALGRYLFFERAAFDQFTETGHWPKSVEFCEPPRRGRMKSR